MRWDFSVEKGFLIGDRMTWTLYRTPALQKVLIFINRSYICIHFKLLAYTTLHNIILGLGTTYVK